MAPIHGQLHQRFLSKREIAWVGYEATTQGFRRSVYLICRDLKHVRQIRTRMERRTKGLAELESSENQKDTYLLAYQSVSCTAPDFGWFKSILQIAAQL